MPLVFSTSQDPQTFIARIQENRLTVRIDDLELLAEEQKTRILERTAAGVDFEGRTFAPYSERSPYYYYPGGKATMLRGTVTRSRLAAQRFFRKINAGRGTPIGEVTRGGAVKFANYAEFKKALGRGGTVDLLGPRAPHMLQSIVKTISGPLEVKLGIYDEEKAAIASGHQTGNARGLPQRRFFGISESDREAMKARLAELLNQRRG